MEDDKVADNEKELTSTSSSDMGRLLSTNKDQKSDSNDSLPTSSTDASTCFKSNQLASDDPISSTSSEMETVKSKIVPSALTDNLTRSTFQGLDTEVELLGMSMAVQPTEKIEENVDDLVNDLETLLGETTESFNLCFKSSKIAETGDESSSIENEASNKSSEEEVSSNTNVQQDKLSNPEESSETKQCLNTNASEDLVNKETLPELSTTTSNEAETLENETNADECVDETKADECIDETKADGCIDETKADGCIDETKTEACIDETKAEGCIDLTKPDKCNDDLHKEEKKDEVHKTESKKVDESSSEENIVDIKEVSKSDDTVQEPKEEEKADDIHHEPLQDSHLEVLQEAETAKENDLEECNVKSENKVDEDVAEKKECVDGPSEESVDEASTHNENKDIPDVSDEIKIGDVTEDFKRNKETDKTNVNEDEEVVGTLPSCEELKEKSLDDHDNMNPKKVDPQDQEDSKTSDIKMLEKETEKAQVEDSKNSDLKILEKETERAQVEDSVTSKIIKCAPQAPNEVEGGCGDANHTYTAEEKQQAVDSTDTGEEIAETSQMETQETTVEDEHSGIDTDQCVNAGNDNSTPVDEEENVVELGEQVTVNETVNNSTEEEHSEEGLKISEETTVDETADNAKGSSTEEEQGGENLNISEEVVDDTAENATGKEKEDEEQAEENPQTLSPKVVDEVESGNTKEKSSIKNTEVENELQPGENKSFNTEEPSSDDQGTVLKDEMESVELARKEATNIESQEPEKTVSETTVLKEPAPDETTSVSQDSELLKLADSSDQVCLEAEDEPIVQEPDEVCETQVDSQDDGIVEVNEEQIQKEHLVEEIDDIPTVTEPVEDTLGEKEESVEESKSEVEEKVGESEPNEIVESLKDNSSGRCDVESKNTTALTEINIRRKTVEQDLEKVVCLSEESSDSDSNEVTFKNPEKENEEEPNEDKMMPVSDDQVTTSAQNEKLIHDVSLAEESSPNQEENDLIQIAKEVEEFQKSKDVLIERQSIGDEDKKLEDLVVVETLEEIKEDRRLSDKELREIEAIRAAVASITDSSQDTYDSYLVDSSVTMDNPIPEDVQEISNSTEPILTEDNLVLSSSGIENFQEEITSKIDKNNIDLEDGDVTPCPELVRDTLKENDTNVNDIESIQNTISEENLADVAVVESSEKSKISALSDMEETVDDKENVINVENVTCGRDVNEENEIVESPSVVNDRPLRNRIKKGNKVNEPLSISVDDVDKEKSYSPKVTIKPLKVPDDEVSTTSDAEVNKGSLKMTITKQSDKMHSILKVFNPEEDSEAAPNQEEPIPKLIIKPKMQQLEQQHSPKMTTRSSKVYSPPGTQRCGSPRVTIKPVIKPPDSKNESVSSLKITFKPVVKPEEGAKRHSPKALKEQDLKLHNPKITIKPIPKPVDIEKEEPSQTTPKVTIKPIKKPSEENEDIEQDKTSPKVTIKPVIHPSEQDSDQSNQTTPRLIIKPIKKQEDEENGCEHDRASPKISIKPLVKPIELEDDEEVKERIVLKINKGNLPTPGKDPKKREYPEDDKLEKLAKIKLKFSTTGGHPHIVQESENEDSNKRQKKEGGQLGNPGFKSVEESPIKRPFDEKLPEKCKRLRTSMTPDKDNEDSDEIKVIEPKVNSPIVISEDSRSQHSADCVIVEEPPAPTPDISKIAEIASRTTHIEASPIMTVGIVTPTVTPRPKKRGRPRKVPLEIREELKDLPVSPLPSSTTSTPSSSNQIGMSGSDSVSSSGGRPKRSCRGQNVIAALGIKPRKPRGGGRGRGGRISMGDRESSISALAEPVQTVPMKAEKETKLSKAKLKLMQKAVEEDVRRKREGETVLLGEEAEKFKSQESETLKSSEYQLLLEKQGDRSLDEVTINLVRERIEVGESSGNPEEGSPKRKGDYPEALSPGKKRKEDKTTPKKVELIKRPKTQVGIAATNVPGATIILDDDDESFEHSKIEEDKEKRATNLVEVIHMDEEKKLEADEASEDIDDDDDEDSEEDRRRELVKQRKQEAIAKCRAKRMEKLAKAAELKKKRQEQAKMQREARLAAEEAERAAAEKARINRRYGRYGNPKPQISLIDEPVRETGGTVKSPRGLFHPMTGEMRISNSTSIMVDEDSNFSGNQQTLKPLEVSNLSLPNTSNQFVNPQKFMSESAAVDTDESPLATHLKFRRSIPTDEIVLMDEETRMSADFRGSRAQTPAKQVVPLPETMVEDSQGSLGTTESGGAKLKFPKAPRLEVHQEPDTNVFTADQLAEYSWNGQGPFMLQEQVAQFLGIKSFKRKYPHVTRRPVDMQERDYLKENGLASEALCDLGLTAVNAQDILDIMYSDFQEKYEDYCKVQREKQARELANKQKALTLQALKPGYEKLDIIEQAVQSAAQWNKQFNKARKEQRKASMDLQSLIIHYPKSKMKPLPTPKFGNYPVALVPGQFTDYFKEFTPTELNNLPLNTMCYDEIKIPVTENDSDEDSSSESDSDSDSSSASGSSDSSSDGDCRECTKHSVNVNGSGVNEGNLGGGSGGSNPAVIVAVTATATV